jgi:hypothetical protein
MTIIVTLFLSTENLNVRLGPQFEVRSKPPLVWHVQSSLELFVYQAQKVHLFRPSSSFLAEAQPRLETRRGHC